MCGICCFTWRKTFPGTGGCGVGRSLKGFQRGGDGSSWQCAVGVAVLGCLGDEQLDARVSEGCSNLCGGSVLGDQDVCYRQFTDMSEGGAPKFGRISKHDHTLSAFYHLPDHAGLSKIGSSEALGGHSADADKSKVGVKGMRPAPVNVGKFDGPERRKGDHAALSAKDV